MQPNLVELTFLPVHTCQRRLPSDGLNSLALRIVRRSFIVEICRRRLPTQSLSHHVVMRHQQNSIILQEEISQRIEDWFPFVNFNPAILMGAVPQNHISTRFNAGMSYRSHVFRRIIMRFSRLVTM